MDRQNYFSSLTFMSASFGFVFNFAKLFRKTTSSCNTCLMAACMKWPWHANWTHKDVNNSDPICFVREENDTAAHKCNIVSVKNRSRRMRLRENRGIVLDLRLLFVFAVWASTQWQRASDLRRLDQKTAVHECNPSLFANVLLKQACALAFRAKSTLNAFSRTWVGNAITMTKGSWPVQHCLVHPTRHRDFPERAMCYYFNRNVHSSSCASSSHLLT